VSLIVNRDALFLVFEALVYPVLLLAATPYLLVGFGEKLFGTWVLFTTAVSFSSLVSIGMSNGTITSIAQEYASNGADAATAAATRSLTLSILLALVASFILWAVSMLPIWESPMISLAAQGVAWAAVVAAFSLEVVDSCLSAIIKGYRRVATAVTIETLFRAVHVSALVFMALNCATQNVLIGYLLAFAAVKVSVKLLWIQQRFRFTRIDVSPSSYARLFNFTMWGAVHGVGGILLFSVDRMVVEANFGVAMLALYATALMIPQQIHALASAGASALLQRLSPSSVFNADTSFHDAFRAAVYMSVPVLTVTAVASAYAVPLTEMWLGRAVPQELRSALPLFYIGFGVLALSVVPHFSFIASGRPKAVAALNISAGVVSVGVLGLSISGFGLIGVALSKVAYALTLAVGFAFLYMRVR